MYLPHKIVIHKLLLGTGLKCIIIIYMKKYLHSDCLREMQFPGSKMQKRGNSVQNDVTSKAL